jgi:IS5 family transposase
MERMLRIYFMQNWFNLSDPQAEDSLYDMESMRRFAGIELAEEDIPDESTILRFRHLLEEHRLTEGIFAEVRSLLEEKRLLLKSGTIVDATIIAAPPSTKNAEGARDPEMRQTKKGKDWHFGMKAHVGTDRRGIVHSVSTTAANVHDSTQMVKLLHGEEPGMKRTERALGLPAFAIASTGVRLPPRSISTGGGSTGLDRALGPDANMSFTL